MTKLTATILAGAIATVTALTPIESHADSGQVAAGVLGGLAVGTLFGAAVASQPRYYAPPPAYIAPAPVYAAPPCYWTLGEPVWDGWRGAWVRPRVQVCD
jgi:hypothetical protein